MNKKIITIILILNLIGLKILNHYSGLYEIMKKGLYMFSLFQYMIAGVILWICILLYLHIGKKGKGYRIAIWSIWFLLEITVLGTQKLIYNPQFYYVKVDAMNEEKIELIVGENPFAGAALGTFYIHKSGVLLKKIEGAHYRVDYNYSPMKNGTYTIRYDAQNERVVFRYLISEKMEEEIVFSID